VLLVLLSCLVPAAPASASVVSVTTSTEMRGDGSSKSPEYAVTVETVTYLAADGERNAVLMALERGGLRVSDRAGVRAGGRWMRPAVPDGRAV